MRMGSVAARVVGLSAGPPVYTRMLAKAGMYLASGSVSSKRPSSYSIMAATEVIGLVIE